MFLLRIALRNILLHKLKTTVIGGVMVFGAVLALIGNSFVDAVSEGMRRSLMDSVTGDLQIYSSDTAEKFSVFGNPDGNMPDIGHVKDFARVSRTLRERIPEIETIVPMGINFAMLNPGNLLDHKLEELRGLHRDRREGKSANPARLRALKSHIRMIIADLEEDFAKSPEKLEFLKSYTENGNVQNDLKTANAPAFWADFDSKAESKIEFLGNRIAPLIVDDTMLYFAYLGTVPEMFSQAFRQFEMVKGSPIPQGSRGFLFNDLLYETQIKHRVARRLDAIKKDIEKNGASIALKKDLKEKVDANVAQAAEIYSQINPEESAHLAGKLRTFLGASSGDSGRDFHGLVTDFLRMDDGNFMDRYRFFYSEIAPHIVLYRVAIGDVFPVTAFTKTGSSSSVNMKVYGTFRFRSFESSPLAGNFSIMDMISFRELYGFQTEEKKKETAALEAEMGLEEVSGGDMDSLFSKSRSLVVEKSGPARVDSAVPSSFGQFEQKRRSFERRYTRQEMEDGVFLNAAIRLRDHDRIDEVMARIREINEKEKLGIQVVNWRDAAGIVGQLTFVVRMLLTVCVLMIFGFASFIIMNSMLMATLERAREIGTMRAIGAQRSFLLRMFLRESLLLSLIFGVVGTVLGGGLVWFVGRSGIPAVGEVTEFFFSGPRLYPSLRPLHVGLVLCGLTLISMIATLYPAWRAMRISPLEAMQKSD